MPELHDLLERQAAGYHPPPDLLPRVRERRRRRERNRRAGKALAVVLLSAVIAGGLSRVPRSPDTVVFEPPSNPWIGTWVSTDTDGSSQTMDVRSLERGTYEVVVADDYATVCSGEPSTMRGAGQFDDVGLVIPAPTLECNDGSTPLPVDGSTVDEALRNYTLVRDAEADTLSDNLGVVWRRPGPTPDADTTEGPVSGGMWPQSTLDEVREAQERADAGDPAFAWQIDPQLDAGSNVGTAEIFTRYLTERLGWEQFVWGTDYDGYATDELRLIEVAFTRCATGQTNPLYPDDPRGGGCAPTINELTFETVNVVAYQPLGTGPEDIWVVQRSYAGQPLRQTVPQSDAEIADLLDAFGRARIDGQGADAFVEEQFYGGDEVPLLYATSTDARYERFDYEVLDEPVWPQGTVNVNLRLFADGGDTVVDQRFEVRRVAGKWLLGYYSSSDDDIATRENGAAVPEPYTLDFGGSDDPEVTGRVTFARDPSWRDYGSLVDGEVVRLHGNPDLEFVVMANPLPPAGPCGVGDGPESADELVRSLRSSRNLSVTPPDATRVGGFDAVQLDVTTADGATTCRNDELSVLARRSREDQAPESVMVGPDSRVRVYVFDVPGKPARTVAVLIKAAKPGFNRVVEPAEPVLQSFELTTD